MAKANQTHKTEPDAIAVPVALPPPAAFGGPPDDWNKGLYKRVINSLYSLPELFRSSLDISGIRATDLYTLNTALGSAIEQSVVDNLNALRLVWDPNKQLEVYSFVRQAQVFPDVRLETSAPNVNPRILMGLELKGWFALGKEGEPSFRYKATPLVCAPADLLVIFPWILDEVVSGKPKLLKPFVSEARLAAEHRNYYWQYLRGISGDDAAVIVAHHQHPYPNKGEKFNDSPIKDPGGNFGRVARGNFMAAFIDELMEQPLAGIPLGAWQRFFKIFAEGFTAVGLASQLNTIKEDFNLVSSQSPESQQAFSHVLSTISEFIKTL